MTKHTTQERTRMTKLQNKAFGLINTLQRQRKIDDQQAMNYSWSVGYGALSDRDVKDVIAKLEVISRQPAPWQRDPNQITTEHVQFWSRGVMVTCTMTRAAAQESVKAGRSFVISSQAIGALVEGRMES